MTIQMFDTVTVDTVPPHPQAVAGYVGGSWPTYEGLVLRFPKALHLSIAVNAGENAQCLDVEPGDASNAEVPAWVERQWVRGIRRPVLYSSVSNMPAILSVLARAGIKRSEVRLWTAHYNGSKHLCSRACNNFGFNDTADATQWTDRSLNRNLDESLCQDEFFHYTHKPSPHYEWFPEGPFDIKGKKLDEELVVQAYDKLRNQPLSRIIPNRPKLAVLRHDLKGLADRVANVAINVNPDKNGKPSWGKFHRGWRYQQLLRRSRGERVVH